MEAMVCDECQNLNWYFGMILVSMSGHAINISNERLTYFADNFAVSDSFFCMTIINIGDSGGKACSMLTTGPQLSFESLFRLPAFWMSHSWLHSEVSVTIPIDGWYINVKAVLTTAIVVEVAFLRLCEWVKLSISVSRCRSLVGAQCGRKADYMRQKFPGLTHNIY